MKISLHFEGSNFEQLAIQLRQAADEIEKKRDSGYVGTVDVVATPEPTKAEPKKRGRGRPKKEPEVVEAEEAKSNGKDDEPQPDDQASYDQAIELLMALYKLGEDGETAVQGLLEKHSVKSFRELDINQGPGLLADAQEIEATLSSA